MQHKLLLPAAAALLFSACGTVRIARINSDPNRFARRTVRVEGNVTNSFGALGTGGYQVDDGTGTIYVISTGTGVPSKGMRVRVDGTVMHGVTVLGKSYGTAIRENGHKVRHY